MSSVDDVPRGAAQERGDAEDDDAGREDEPAPVAIGERAGGEDERGERDRVGVDDPLQPRQARVELRCTLGSATFTIVMSTSSMNVVAQTATSVQRRARAAPSIRRDASRRARLRNLRSPTPGYDVRRARWR